MKFNAVGNTAFKKFLNENKSLKIMLPVLAVAVIALIVFSVSGGFKNDKKSIPSSQNSEGPLNDIDANLQRVEVLPQTIRSNNPGNAEIKKDPFKDIMKLVGVVYAGDKSTAIIEWGDYSYIVKVKVKIGDSDWSVSNIERNSVTIVSGNDSIVLDLTEGSSKNDDENNGKNNNFFYFTNTNN